MVTLYSNKESSDVAKAVGDYIIKIQDESIQKAGVFKVAVSGGSLGKGVESSLDR